MKPTRVLIVEDNSVDVKLIEYALRQTKTWPTETFVAEDGEKAIKLLTQSGTVHPDLIVLDLNLPKRPGTEVLATIRNSPELCELPVAVVSSSPLDVIRYKVSEKKLEADGYFTKPMDIDAFLDLAEELHNCWRTKAKLQ